ncbi:hypothetical protein [Methanogenium sp. MK-MG]|uniref:hypothetical protein n=1 Tax=Methanogenium sp. MK-MG TaxID=2599926 RepID=UPI0013EDF622|nr:hypothetical protein [Methanogenium sp. MK-MG]KAF1078758.1 hypothetical protein MKMG_00308 [Methanogenium sp. MK-MG]
MLKKRGILIVVLLLCFTVSAVSAYEMISSEKSVCPEEIYLNESGCMPDTTTVTIEVTGSGCGILAPYYVNLVEVTESYIVGEADFSITPDSVVENGDGTTTMTWLNIGQYVGNKNKFLTKDETFVVTFTAGSDVLGEDLPVDTEEAVITYRYGIWGEGCVLVDQAWLDVIKCPPTPVPEFPTVALPLSMIVGLLGAAIVLRR